MKVAIVYDWMDSNGGVERFLVILKKIFPEAVYFTSYYDADRATWASDSEVKTSFIQKLPRFIRQSRIISLLLYPYAFESFDFSGYDLVISVTSAFAKGILVKPETKHLCILLSPPRYLWDLRKTYLTPFLGFISLPVSNYLRKWDYVAAQRPDTICSISQLVKRRAKKHYKRETEVLHPPFDMQYWENVEEKIPPGPPRKAFYLIVARLEEYKRIDIALETFKNLPDRELIVIGTGKSKARLKENSSPNVHFLDHISDGELLWHYKNAKALIMPQEEDYGYTALEAIYAGCPVISYRHSGSQDIVQDGRTGLFFDEQNAISLGDALARFEAVSYNVGSHRSTILEQFSVERFQELLKKSL